ncbi:MAG: YihY/virulence factor BrkB family protein [Planctomycetes bacterium]|nr:YihY/virulence factor BrkB family protein [Planctomycetota bacterium]
MRLWNEIKEIFSEERSLSELMRPGQTGVRLRQTLLLIRELWRSIRRDDVFNMASALAFKTLLAMVPVLAITLAFVAIFEPEGGGSTVGHTNYSEQFIQSIKDKIPEFPGIDSVIESVRSFAENARAIASIGFAALFWTAFTLLNSIELSFNKIWQVAESRSILSKLSAFLTTLIIVPVLMVFSVYLMNYIQVTAEGALQSSEQNIAPIEPGTRELPANETPAIETNAGKSEAVANASATESSNDEPTEMKTDRTALSAPEEEKEVQPQAGFRLNDYLLQVVLIGTSIIMTCVAMTALIYLMPNTPVRLKAALAGGLFAGILFEGAKFIFRYYASQLVVNYTKIYGPLLAVPLFLVWILVVWIIVLIGVELAFSSQNFRNLAIRAELEKRGITSRIYLAVRIVLRACRYFRIGENPSEFVDKAAEELQVPPYMAREIISCLVQKNVMRRVIPGEDNFIPAKDIGVLTVGEVIGAIQSDALDVPSSPDDPMRRHLADLFAKTETATANIIGDTTFADLVNVEEQQQKMEAESRDCGEDAGHDL